MTDVAAAAVIPQPSPAGAAPQTRRGPGARTYLLAGCSVGGTLCASLASASGVNLAFAVASAVFGGLIVVLTAAPGIGAAAAPPAPGAVAVPAASDGATVSLPARPPGSGALAIGISAAVLSFIMNQIAQVAFGFGLFSLVGELTAEEMFGVSAIIGLSVLMVKVPFDLLLGAYLVARARSIFAALGAFVAAYFVVYMVEQAISATMGMSGLVNTAANAGLEAVLWGFAWILGLPLLTLALGACGARLAALLLRRKA